MVKVTSFDIVKDLVPVSFIRKLAEFKDDELVRLMFAYLICEHLGGLRIEEIPSKMHKRYIAIECLKRGWGEKRIVAAIGISRKTIKRIMNEIRSDTESN